MTDVEAGRFSAFGIRHPPSRTAFFSSLVEFRPHRRRAETLPHFAGLPEADAMFL